MRNPPPSVPPAPSRAAGSAALASAVAACAVALLGGLFALHRLYDFDLLWHVKTGAFILAERAVPRTDPFGGATAGLPWLDVAWGAQVIAATVAARGGLVAVQLGAAALVVATLLAMLLRAPRTPIVLAAAILAVLSAGHRFLPRPDLLALLFVPLVVLLVDRLPAGGRRTPALLALCTAAWANLHGSFVLAPGLVATAAAGWATHRGLRSAARLYGPALALAALAPLLNPRGPLIYGVLTPYVGSMLAAIGAAPAGSALVAGEWRPTLAALLDDAIFPTGAFLLLVLILCLSFLRRGRDVSRPRLACALALLALALTAVRNLLPFAAAALAWVIANERDRLATSPRDATEADPFDAAWFRLTGAIFVLVVTLSYGSAVLSDRYYVARQLPITTGVGFDPALVPEGAVQWLAAHEPPGVLFNNYNSGSYLLYRLAPAVRVYIDARFDTTPVNRAIEAAIADPDAALDPFLARESIGAIVLLHPAPESLAFLPRLTPEYGWALAWRDANTTIHLRAGTVAAPRAAPIPLPPANPPAAERINALLARFKAAVLPAAELTDAFVSGILGDTDRQRTAYRRALARAPDDPKALAGVAATAP